MHGAKAHPRIERALRNRMAKNVVWTKVTKVQDCAVIEKMERDLYDVKSKLVKLVRLNAVSYHAGISNLYLLREALRSLSFNVLNMAMLGVIVYFKLRTVILKLSGLARTFTTFPCSL
jgi:hypothetical protein